MSRVWVATPFYENPLMVKNRSGVRVPFFSLCSVVGFRSRYIWRFDGT